MKRLGLSWIPALVLAALSASCQSKSPSTATAPPPDAEATIQAYLANLSPEDKSLAEKQKYCPVMPEIRLGEYGTPYKVMIKGEPVFVCCRTCVQPAQEEPEKTLAQLKELKGRAAGGAAH